ncbi:MAG: hypothetical protein ACJ74Y_04840 [Bryobacteraceae bacterium]
MDLLRRIRSEAEQCWQSSRALTGLTAVMLAAFLASVAGIGLDARMVAGAPVWLKPAKFAISSAIYAGTLAWLFRYIQVRPRALRSLGMITAAVLAVEVGIIDLQAARGTTSHFNVGSPLNATLWGTMGVAIGILWLASIGILIALCRQKFGDRGFGWALRLGMLITVIGSATGGLMVGPTEQQRAVMTHHAPQMVGSHTVGAPDGGPGLPGVGWSSNHGDLRIPHFLGLHALQLIPLLYLLRTGRSGGMRRTTDPAYVFVTSSSYLALIGILTWQALRGQSIVQPDSTTAWALLLWLAGTGLALAVPRMKSNNYRQSTVGVV